MVAVILEFGRCRTKAGNSTESMGSKDMTFGIICMTTATLGFVLQESAVFEIYCSLFDTTKDFRSQSF